MTQDLINKPVLLFDGFCNLCHASVQFVLKHEKKPDLLFCSLQSEKGLQLLKAHSIDPQVTNSLVLIENGKAYKKSSAALRVTKYLRGAFQLSLFFMIIPAFIRNAVYDFISKNRYKWYGKKETCIIPVSEMKSRFL
ncbi:MAG: hypothetical protein K0R26_647 [Bacteroidota bacterium]|jgi:predicted DCC family thiol-disulfide oxidoreductase YuxK|nr:hypothetical protein [Bacteroidota bacterium]